MLGGAETLQFVGLNVALGVSSFFSFLAPSKCRFTDG
jgi:hypothetical protein